MAAQCCAARERVRIIPAGCRCERRVWPRSRPTRVHRPSARSAHCSSGRSDISVQVYAGHLAKEKIDQTCFASCPPAATRLKQRWGLLQREGRFEQLVWEANRLRKPDPDWLMCTITLCTALVGLQRFAEARVVMTNGAQRHPRDPVWQQLGCQIEELERRDLNSGRARPRTPPNDRGERARVVVASAFCGEDFNASMQPARENHARWCALHGYTYACLEHNIAGRADPTWSKIPHVTRLLEQGAEYVFWMDADSLFIHDGVDLQWACDLDRDFVFAGDLNVVFNAGHFLARRGEWVTNFLAGAFRIHPWPHWEDNGAMMIMLGGGSADDPETWMPAFESMKVPTRSQEECDRAMRELLPPHIASHVAIVPQHRINAYEWPGGGGMAAVVRGDPILHFAGCTASEKVQLVAKFSKCIGDPETLLRIFG